MSTASLHSVAPVCPCCTGRHQEAPDKKPVLQISQDCALTGGEKENSMRKQSTAKLGGQEQAAHEILLQAAKE